MIKKNITGKKFGGRLPSHGQSRTRFYHTYKSMQQRCSNINNPYFHCYGKRGIKCFWNTFEEFRDDMYESYLDHVEKFGQQNTTLERVDNNGNYCKKNCKWATLKEQANNRRNNANFSLNGKTMSIQSWSTKTGIKYSTIKQRIYHLQWPIKKALTTPTNPYFFSNKI